MFTATVTSVIFNIYYILNHFFSPDIVDFSTTNLISDGLVSSVKYRRIVGA